MNTEKKSPTRSIKSAAETSKGEFKETARSDPLMEPSEHGHPSPSGLCFVISPFGGWSDAYYEAIFLPAIASAGLRAQRADSLFRSSNIVHDIWRLVTTAKVMVADLTGKNPNVFYELGLAHAARKPVLLLTQDIEDIPFDLRALRVIRYDTQHPKWGELLQIRITKGLQETLESPETAVLPTFLREEPDQPPLVSAEEKRLLGLEQQLSSLRAEVRTNSPIPPSSIPSSVRLTRSVRTMERADADRLLKILLKEGVTRQTIRQVLISEGAPDYWVDVHLDDDNRRAP